MKFSLFPHIFRAYLIAKRKWIVLLREQCENHTFLKDLTNGLVEASQYLITHVLSVSQAMGTTVTVVMLFKGK